MSRAVKPVVDLLATELRAARDASLLNPADIDRDAELLARLIMSLFHSHAFVRGDAPITAVADQLWTFCLVGLTGHAASASAQPRAVSPNGPGSPGAPISVTFPTSAKFCLRAPHGFPP
jgi:hypothetical protein